MLFVYALHHDSSRELYIGKASHKQRPYEHFKAALGGSDLSPHNIPVHQWIRFLDRQGLKYEVTVLEILDSQKELREAEIFFIDLFRSVGALVLNSAPGGGGIGTGIQLTSDWLKRIRVVVDEKGLDIFEDYNVSVLSVARAVANGRLRRGTIEQIKDIVLQIEKQNHYLTRNR